MYLASAVILLLVTGRGDAGPILSGSSRDVFIHDNYFGSDAEIIGDANPIRLRQEPMRFSHIDDALSGDASEEYVTTTSLLCEKNGDFILPNLTPMSAAGKFLHSLTTCCNGIPNSVERSEYKLSTLENPAVSNLEESVSRSLSSGDVSVISRHDMTFRSCESDKNSGEVYFSQKYKSNGYKFEEQRSTTVNYQVPSMSTGMTIPRHTMTSHDDVTRSSSQSIVDENSKSSRIVSYFPDPSNNKSDSKDNVNYYAVEVLTPSDYTTEQYATVGDEMINSSASDIATTAFEKGVVENIPDASTVEPISSTPLVNNIFFVVKTHSSLPSDTSPIHGNSETSHLKLYTVNTAINEGDLMSLDKSLSTNLATTNATETAETAMNSASTRTAETSIFTNFERTSMNAITASERTAPGRISTKTTTDTPYSVIIKGNEGARMIDFSYISLDDITTTTVIPTLGGTNEKLPIETRLRCILKYRGNVRPQIARVIRVKDRRSRDLLAGTDSVATSDEKLSLIVTPVFHLLGKILPQSVAHLAEKSKTVNYA